MDDDDFDTMIIHAFWIAAYITLLVLLYPEANKGYVKIDVDNFVGNEITFRDLRCPFGGVR